MVQEDEKGQATEPVVTPEEVEAAKEAKLEKIARALPLLKKHLEKNPKDVSVRAQYARILFESGDARAAFAEVIKARNQAPDNAGLAFGLDSLMRHFIAKNVLAVGTSKDKIEAVLGSPTKESDGSSVQRLVYGHWAIDFTGQALRRVVNLKGVTEAHFTPTELVGIDLDSSGWACGLRVIQGPIVSAHFYKPNESIKSYTERVVVARFPNAGNGTIKETVDELISQEEKLLPGVVHTVIAEKEESALLEVAVPALDSIPKQYRLVRLFKGEKDLHRVTMTFLSDKSLGIDRKRMWIEIFESAKLRNTDEKSSLGEGVYGTPFKASERNKPRVKPEAKPEAEAEVKPEVETEAEDKAQN